RVDLGEHLDYRVGGGAVARLVASLPLRGGGNSWLLCGQWEQGPGRVDVAQLLSTSRFPLPRPSQTMSAGWFRCSSLSRTVSLLSSAPPPSCWADTRTTPPDTRVVPELPRTELSSIRVRTAPI